MSATAVCAPAATAPAVPRRAASPYWLAAVLFVIYLSWSVHRHLRLRTSGYDLGIFEQAVRGYAHLGAPEATLKAPGFNLLGDHFHPILVLLAPLYRLFPSPITLLSAQAALIAVSSIPITRLAVRVAGRGAAVSAGLAYGLSWGLQSAVDFDFHEVAFAVPLLAFGLTALAERRFTAAAGWTLPLIAVKEDLPATVAVIGLLIVLRGGRRPGATTTLVAICSGLVIVGAVLPALNPAHVYPYAGSVAGDGQDPLHRLLLPAVKLHTLVWLLAPTLFGALRSPLLLAVVPTLAWRFWAANPLYWGTGFQYSAVLMPIVFVAFLDALAAPGTGRAARAAAHTTAVLAVAATLLAPLPLRGLLSPGTWAGGAETRQVRSALARIPDDAEVAADNRLAPQLTARCVVLFHPDYPRADRRPEWVAVSVPADTSMAAPATMAAARDRLPALGYRVVLRTSGVIIFRRGAVDRPGPP
ncbi:DUF2079 domain-containing protein [Actinoplanes sp. N902-109]|uniref:DUF2079 domain-containing protein n=1 Tax=Actinoplanes sp. (strain N902-109) TaxID=649831 RepID=UPI0003294AFA|nr:DUF2079 domain-containing protein [Actinoplanes sp. N902-109]AGL17421.1 hypothetical protein L083_3911 [Actinoplanes sp. N902-109]